MAGCEALAETEMNTIPHTEVFICDLEDGHEGPHKAILEWEGGEWTKLVDPVEEEVDSD